MTTDIESIGVEFDTSGLNKGTEAFEQNEKAAKKAAAQADAFEAKMKRQAETLGMTAAELRRYDAMQLKVNASQAAAIVQYIKAIEAQEELAAKTEKTTAASESMFTSMLKAAAVEQFIRSLTSALSGMFDRVVAGAAGLDDFSERTGQSVEELSKLSQQAFISGMSFDTVMTAADRLSRGLSKVDDETKGVGKALEYMGVKAKNNDGTLKSSAALMQDVAVALDKYEDGAGKVALAQALFGRGAAQMIPYLKDLAAAGEIQANVTSEQAAMAEKYEKQQRATQLAVENYVRVIVLDMLPSLTAAKMGFLDGAKELLGYTDNTGRAVTGTQALTQAFRNVAMGAAITTESIVGVLKMVRALAGSFEAVWADVKLGAMNYSPAQLAKNAVTGDLQKMFEEREKTVKAANQRYVDLWNYNGTAISDAVRKAFDKADVEAAVNSAKRLEDAFWGASGGGKSQAKFSEGKDSSLGKAAKELNKELKDQAKIVAELGGLQPDFLEQWEKRNKMFAQGRLTTEELTASQAMLLAQQPAIKKATKEHADELKATDKAAIDAAKAHEKWIIEITKGTDKLQNEIDKQREHNAAIGMSKEGIADLEAAKLDEQATALEGMAIRKMEKDLDEGVYDLYLKQAAALRELGKLKREGASKQAVVDSNKKIVEEWEKTTQKIEDTLTDALMRGFESGKGFMRNLRDAMKNMFNTLVLRPIIQGVMSPIAGMVNGAMQSILGTGSSAGSGILGQIGSSVGQTALGQMLNIGGAGGIAGSALAYNAAVPGLTSMGAGSQAAMLAAQTGEFGLAGLTSTASAGGATMGGMSGLMSTLGPIAAFAAILALGAQTTKGETRSGGEYGYNFDTKTADFIRGPSGGDPNSDATKTIIAATAMGLNDAFKALGRDATVTGFRAGWETSQSGRGGVYAGGSIRDGQGNIISFGEDGSGTNYDPRSMKDSKYEQWNSYTGKTSLNEKGQLQMVDMGDFDSDGTPQKFSTDVGQSFIAALQASYGLIPKIVQDSVTVAGTVANAEQGSMNPDWEARRFTRVFDDEMKQRIRELGEMPKRVMDLILDIDPEALSAEATTELTSKLSTLISNVNGFRNLVANLPVEELKNKSFDFAAAVVEYSGGLEKFTSNLLTYIDKFYTGDEKRRFAAQSIKNTLDGVGLNFSIDQILTGNKDKFRELVEAFAGRTDEAGMKAYATLLSVAGAFDTLTVSAENTESVLNKLKEATDNALEGLRKAIQREKELLQVQIDSKEGRVEALKGVFDMLSENIRELQGGVDSTKRANAASGNAFLAIAKAQLKAGVIPDQGLLGNAISDARNGLDGNNFATKFDFDREQLRLAGRLSELKDLAGPQLTVEQQQLDILKRQLKQLDETLEYWERQAELARGGISATLTVVQAVDRVYAAIIAENPSANVPPPSSGGQAPSNSGGGAVFGGGNASSGSGGYTWGNGGVMIGITSLGVPIYGPPGSAPMPTNTGSSSGGAAWGASVPGYATGGYHEGGWAVVGERGKELIDFSSPARIYNASETRQMMSTGGQEGLMNVMAGIRADNRAFQSQFMIRFSELMRLFKKWDGDGLPNFREEEETA